MDRYVSRDLWSTQSQSARPYVDTVWGSQVTEPMAVAGINVSRPPVNE